jgi:hypothetical protein
MSNKKAPVGQCAMWLIAENSSEAGVMLRVTSDLFQSNNTIFCSGLGYDF